MTRLKLFVVLLTVLGGCATPPKYEARRVDSPMPDELMPESAYVGQWEIQKCLNAKQAEKVEFVSQEEGLKLKRWQWKTDLLPLFEVQVRNEKQNVVTYQSKDMHDLNPVVNHTTWTWADNRVVGTFQWQPDKEDQRGNWSGVAMAQFYIKKDEPNKLYWNRWGTSHSSQQGMSQWKSSCTYAKVQAPPAPKTAAEIQAERFVFTQELEVENTEKLEARNRQVDPDVNSQRDEAFLRKGRRQKSDQLNEVN